MNRLSANYERLAQAYQSLGNQKYLLGDYHEADLYLNKAIGVIEQNGLQDDPIYASCLNSVGALNEAIASYDEAKKSYAQAYEISKGEGVSKRLKVASASNLANIINFFDPLNDSISMLYKEALLWQEQLTGRMHPDFANLLNKRGLSLQRLSQYDSAAVDYQEAAGILEYTVGLSHPEYLVSISNLGLLYADMGRDEEALSQMREAKNLYEAYYADSNPGYILTINNLANQYTKVGEYENAEKLFLQLTDIGLQEINDSFTYLSESEKKDFVAEKKKFLENLKKYIVTRYIKEEAEVNPEILLSWYNLELNIKGILLNSTKKVRDQIFSSGNEDLISLFSDWTVARKQVADLQSLKSENIANAGKKLDSLNSQISALEKEISRSSAAFGTSFSKGSISYANIRDALGPGEASIEVVRIAFEKDIIYVALYANNTLQYPKLIVIGKDDPLEKKAYQTYKNTIAYKVSNSTPFNAYWKPVHDQLIADNITKVYFTPD
ncbi:MAG: tetratricopeptide repeat protein, partial [Bacteroidota bacterium]